MSLVIQCTSVSCTRRAAYVINLGDNGYPYCDKCSEELRKEHVWHELWEWERIAPPNYPVDYEFG
jgi:hypothetical protein